MRSRRAVCGQFEAEAAAGRRANVTNPGPTLLCPNTCDALRELLEILIVSRCEQIIVVLNPLHNKRVLEKAINEIKLPQNLLLEITQFFLLTTQLRRALFNLLPRLSDVGVEFLHSGRSFLHLLCLLCFQES